MTDQLFTRWLNLEDDEKTRIFPSVFGRMEFLAKVGTDAEKRVAERFFLEVECAMRKIRQITKEQAKAIIETRKPLGKFWLMEGEIFVGIDNELGHAWTEDFEDLDECLEWLG